MGFVNGYLVVKGRINAFIVTLGTMIVVTGLMHLYSDGGSKSVDDFRFADWLETPFLSLLTPYVRHYAGPCPCREFHLEPNTSGSCFLHGGRQPGGGLACGHKP